MANLRLSQNPRSTRPLAIGFIAVAIAASCFSAGAASVATASELDDVTMTAPTAGSSVRGTAVGLAASTDLSLVLSSVQFQRAIAGSGVWINVGPADALLGGETASAPVAVTVDNAPPTVSVTSPGATNLRDLVHVGAESADVTS